jgi:small conductance mechanosensitive channel
MIHRTCLAFIALVAFCHVPAQLRSEEDGPVLNRPADVPAPSEAERIARAHRTIETTRKLVAEIQAQIDDPEGEYQKFQASFLAAEEELQQKRKELESLKAEGKTEEAAGVEGDLPRVERKWRLIKERFELKIEERQQLIGQLETLKHKLAKDQEALNKLIGPVAGESESPAAQPPTTPRVDTPSPPLTHAVTEPLPQPAASQASVAAGPLDSSADDEAQSEELQAATELANQKQAEAVVAEDAARSITERIALLQESVKTARALRETTRKQVDNADASVHALEAAVQRRQFEEATPEQLQQVQSRLADARARLGELRAESRERANTLDALQVELTELQAEQIKALREAGQRRAEADAARKRVDDLKNPFAPRNLAQWSLDHGPRMFAILLAMGSLVWLSRVLEARLVDLIARRGGRGSVEERENRAKTLVGVFRNAATMVIIAGGILMLLDEVGVPIAPLMGGAAVFGLAVAFGAQSLIKDFFSGFMILLEQQYMVNDVIKIGDISGQVERISLRTTVLRDLEGRVHFVPHGQITSTTNMTHGWSRAVFDIGVAYKEDVNRVMDVLVELGKQLRRDPEFGPLILEDPVMLGVDSLADSAVVLKFFLKTRPLRQWPVKRELLRRIKVAFDELGIEIPYPHRTVFHRHASDRVLHAAEIPSDWSRRVA